MIIGGVNMVDGIIIILVGVTAYFMIRNGGCCGGFKKHDNKTDSKDCCNKKQF
jgi:hypothetical protein